MPKIHILDDKTVAKIAAGEVIERAGSVVKELVENSIDAGATRIAVELKSGGKSLIRVIDNGCGMSRDDAILSFQKHATSKICTLEDLDTIRTLGFRGEALTSICAAADVEILTKSKNELSGTYISVESGNVSVVKDAGCPEGTTISVNHIFMNTPARLKHQKPERVELSYIIDIVSKYALVRPEISFRIINNENEFFKTSGTNKTIDTIISIYGVEYINDLIEINYSEEKISIKGYIGKPSLNRSSSDSQCIFINGRAVKNKLINNAIRESYGTMLPKNRYPFGILFIRISPELVDVNVHPTKNDVRFANENLIYTSIVTACSSLLNKKKFSMYPEIKAKDKDMKIKQYSEKDQILSEEQVIKRHGAENIQQELPFDSQFSSISKLPVTKGIEPSRTTKIPRVFGLAHDTYALLETDEGIMIMDQHAAHERILFEEFKGIMEKSTLDSQELISAFNIELTSKESVIVDHYCDDLKRIGFTIERFGGNTYTIRSIPAIITGIDEKAFVHDVLDDLIREARTLGKNIEIDQLLMIVSKRAATAACRAAVKAGDAVPLERLQMLIIKLFTTKNPYSCPHGRPTMITITKHELEKKFGRIS